MQILTVAYMTDSETVAAFEGQTSRRISRSTASPSDSYRKHSSVPAHVGIKSGRTYVGPNRRPCHSHQRTSRNGLDAIFLSSSLSLALVENRDVDQCPVSEQSGVGLTRERLHTVACRLNGKPDRLASGTPQSRQRRRSTISCPKRTTSEIISLVGDVTRACD